MLTIIFVCGLLTGTSQARVPDAISLTTQVEDQREKAAAMKVEAFVAERIHETWGIRPNTEPIDQTSDRQFEVSFHWMWPRVTIQINQGQELLVNRPITVENPDTARAMVWLLVRSTIDRVAQMGIDLLDAPAPLEADGTPSSRASVEFGFLGEGDRDDASVEQVEPEPRAFETSSLALPTRQFTPSTNEAVGSDQPTAETNPPHLRQASTANSISAGFVFRGVVETDSGLAFGPNLQVRLALLQSFRLGLEIGSRDASIDDFELQHIPISISGGIQPYLALPFEVGTFLTVDARRVTGNVSSGWTFGALMGGYARTFWSVWSAEGNSAVLMADVLLSTPLIRRIYHEAEFEAKDGLAVLAFGVGLEWQWY